MKKCLSVFLGLAIVSSLTLVDVKKAAAAITPVSVKSSTTFYTYDENDLINNTGMSGNLHDANWENMWLSESGDRPWLTFDLGGIYSVFSANIWQYNSDIGYDRGIKDLAISGSLDGINFSPVTNATLAMESGGWIAAQNVLLNTTARYIHFQSLGNYGNAYTGLSEVKFNAEPVPEPATMLLLGSGLVGLLGFNKKKKEDVI